MSKKQYEIDITVIERIQKVMQDSKCNTTAFASSVQFDVTSLSRVLNGKRPAPDSLLRSIARVYNIRYNWLLTGEGEMKEDADESVAADQPGEPSEMSRILSLLEASHETIRKRDEQIDRLITLLEKEAERTEAITRRAV